MNQTEIDELRRLHENNERSCQALGGPAHCRGDKKLHTRCQCADMAWDALPRLLAALEEAMAERDRMRDVLLRNNFAPCDTQACNCGGWHERATGDGFYARFREIEEAIGDHNGKTVLAAVVEMVQERDSLEEARAERSEARSLLLNGIQTNGDSLAFLEHVRREHAAVVAERDALKTTLAKHAESERAWCEMATERGAKLAALVKTVDSAVDNVDHRLSRCSIYNENNPVCDCGVGEIRAVLAAAKVQP